MAYLVFGPEKGLVKSTINKLINTLNTDNDCEIIKFDALETSVDSIIDECNQFSFLGTKKIVICKNSFFIENKKEKIKFENDYDKVIDYLQNENDSTYLIFAFYGEKISNSSKIGKYFNSKKNPNHKIYECKKISKTDWPIFVERKFAKANIKINSDAINELLYRINFNLESFENEYNKLVLYGKTTITKDDVCTIVSKPIEDDVFTILNALFANEKDKAIERYRDLKANKKIYDAVQCIALLASSLIFLKKVQILKEKKYSSSEIANTLNANPYRIAINLKTLANIKKTAIDNCLLNLYELDKKIKRSQIDGDFGLEMLFINFN